MNKIPIFQLVTFNRVYSSWILSILVLFSTKKCAKTSPELLDDFSTFLVLLVLDMQSSWGVLKTCFRWCCSISSSWRVMWHRKCSKISICSEKWFWANKVGWMWFFQADMIRKVVQFFFEYKLVKTVSQKIVYCGSYG